MAYIKTVTLSWFLVFCLVERGLAQYGLKVDRDIIPLQSQNHISLKQLLKSDTIRMVFLQDTIKGWIEINRVSIIVQPQGSPAKLFYLRSGAFEKELMKELKRMNVVSLSVMQYAFNNRIRPLRIQIILDP